MLLSGEIHGARTAPREDYHPTSRRPIADVFRATAVHTVQWCVAHRIHPDVVSYLSVVASMCAAVLFWKSGRFHWLLLIAPLPCYLRLWLNMLDGMVALASHTASRRGEILNELPDRMSDVLIFVGVAHSGWVHMPTAYLAAIGALFTAYVGTLGQAVANRREYGGLMAKPWRMVMLHIGSWITLLLLAIGAPLAWRRLTVLDWTCIVVILGCVQTVIVRLSSTFRILAGGPVMSTIDAPAATTTTTSAPAVADTTLPPSAPPKPTVPAATEHTFAASDGTALFYRAWLPAKPTTKALLLLHRGHEHSGRLVELVEQLGLEDVAVFAWDQRGHGKSPGERGGAENLITIVKDLQSFALHICDAHGVKLQDSVILAHSVGAVIASTWLHDFAPPLRGMVLATPAFRVKLYVPLAVPALRLKQRFMGPGVAKSYVKSRVLTHDPQQQAAYDADPMIFRQIPVNILLDLHDTATRIIDDAGAITVPTLMLAAGNDWVVKRSAQWRFFQNLGSRIKQFDVLPGMYHAIFHERGREETIARVRQFILDCYARDDAAQVQRDLLDADRGGYTRTEYDRLRLPDHVGWRLQRLFMNTLGRLSDGIRLGWEHGFDSGVMLDYVYANKPAGKSWLGRSIDKQYLNSPGWSGIRVRRYNLQRILCNAIEDLHEQGKPVHILDIASGPGRYVLETIKMLEPGIRATAVLRDYKDANLNAAKTLAESLELSDRVTIVKGDAFDRASLAAVEPKPNIVVVSGLYELFPENEPLRRSLAGLADAIQPGGYLIYTCQPWHPQLEFIARVLSNREGRKWVMRRRTQREMDALIENAGFKKLTQDIDRCGIFTVSIAQRA